MKVKYLIPLVISIVNLLIPASAYADAVSDLAIVAKQVNAQCPLDMGLSGICESVTFDKKSRTLAYHVNLNPGLVTKESFFQRSPDSIKQSLIAGFSEDNTRPLMQLLYDATAQLLMDYNIGGEHIADVILTTYDIGKILNNNNSEKENAKIYLAGTVKQEKLSCPMEMGEGITMTDAYIDGNKMIYVYHVKAPVSIANLKAADKTLKFNLLSMFNNDPTLKTIGHKAYLAGYSINYIYLDPSTQDSYTAVLTNEDLEEL
ncbi:MAG: hypothetical protein K2M31_06850 [Muribaculaceae bacterium]|nr:hypothetical protein [Muribaculaceae bacterium]